MDEIKFAPEYSGEEYREWRENVNFYEVHKPRIRKHYTPQEFIVIEHQRIIDSGTDDFALARKYSKEKREVFIISPHHSDDVCEISTPEFFETIPL